MWKVLVISTLIVALSQARPQSRSQYNNQQYNRPQQNNNQQYNRPQQNNNQYRDAYITRYESENQGLGSYYYDVETSDGFKKQESGQVQNPELDDSNLVVKGSYSYVGPDGVTYTVEYLADENGFQPAGEHIPPSAGVRKLGVPSAALASLAGGGLG